MKKFLSILLAGLLSAGALAGCGGGAPASSAAAPASSTPASSEAAAASGEAAPADGAILAMDATPTDKYTIAVAFNTANESTEIQKRYLSEEIAPALNVEFIFSEAILEVEALLTFMENSFASGANAVINFNPNAHEAGAAKAEELGLYFVTQASKHFDTVETLQYNLGEIGADAAAQGVVFGEVAKEIMNDGKAHNVIVVSGGAGMGVQSHYDTTKAILETLQTVNGLTYDKPVEELTASTAITEVATGTDMKVVIYPGFPGADTYVSDFSSLLQTGEYDVVLSTFPTFQVFGVAIDEVEKAKTMDIKQVHVTSIDDATSTAFSTQDSQGSAVLDAAVINPLNNANALCVAVLYNALTGHKDKICPDGVAIQLGVTPWKVIGAEGYNNVASLDTNHDTYCVNSNDMKQLLYVYNPAVNYDTLVTALQNLTAENLVQAKLGK